MLEPERKQKMGSGIAVRSKEVRPVGVTTRKGGAGRGRGGRGRPVPGMWKEVRVTRGRNVRKTTSSVENIMRGADPAKQVKVKQEIIDEVESRARRVSEAPKRGSEKEKQRDLLGYGFNKGASV